MTTLPISSISPMPVSPSREVDAASSSKTSSAESVRFADLLSQVGSTVSNPDASQDVHPKISPLVAHESRKAAPLEQFEGFVLRSFVESMLPTEASTFFGKGTAGQIWRSMLAEHIGDELARHGGIGIADAIAGKDRIPSTGVEAGASSATSAREVLRESTVSAAGINPSHVLK